MIDRAQALVDLLRGSDASLSARQIVNRYPPQLDLQQSESIVPELADLERELVDLRSKVTVDIANLKTIQSCSDTIDKSQQTLRENGETARALREALKIVEMTRKEYLTGLLQTIAGQVNCLYEKIHPQEEVGEISFVLQENQKASLDVLGLFETASGIAPQGYYSESHLDTLAICIFLATALRDNSQNALIVLDDVLTSVDENHLQRFVDLILKEVSPQRQVIFTTHSRRLRDHFKPNGGKLQIVDLLEWSLREGIRHSKERFEVETLAGLLNRKPLDRDAITTVAGKLLERVLDHLALLYECKLPRRQNNHWGPRDLFDATAKVRSLLVVGGPDASESLSISPFFEGVDRLIDMRNKVGAHYNENGADIPNEEIKKACSKVLQLLQLLFCADCKELPSKKEGTKHVCGCGHKWLMLLAASSAKERAMGATST